jgi:5-(carboxyamino)imidazole ribonucleotide mutase
MGALVGIIMGSDSDLPTMRGAVDACSELGIETEVAFLSAHRTPERAAEYARTAADRGLKAIIAGAGGAAHLAGVIASLTTLPVIGVPILTASLAGMDSLFSIVQMPRGIPVACVGIGNAYNAGLLAARILSVADPELAKRLVAYQAKLQRSVEEKQARLEEVGVANYKP